MGPSKDFFDIKDPETKSGWFNLRDLLFQYIKGNFTFS